MRERFAGSLVWCGRFDGAAAQAALDCGLVDPIAFGRPYIANPDLVERLRNHWPPVEAGRSGFDTRDDEKGHADFTIRSRRGLNR